MASKSHSLATAAEDTRIILFFFLLVFASEVTIQMNVGDASSPNTNTSILFQQENHQGHDDDAMWLLSFKASISADPSSLLHSWNSSTHPCNLLSASWYGVSCDTLSAKLVVVSLNLTGISVSGTLSSSLANLTHLRILSLAHNAFSGPIPPALGYISSLQVLELQGCNFSGSIPPSFVHLFSLRFLNLSNNSLSGPIPNALISSAPSLSVLDLSNNLLSGNILNILKPSSSSAGGSCQFLTYLSLSNNFLADEIPLDIGHCSNLTILLLDGNILQGKIPIEIGRLSKLRILDISRNSLTKAIPIELAGCLSLSVLVLTNLLYFPHQGTTLTLVGSSDFASFRGEFNAFDGDLPPEVLFLPNLQMLWAPRANLGGGPLPTNWTTSCSLRVLNLAQNNITGSMPQSLIAMCTNLTYLDLSSNALLGFLPSNLLTIIPCMVYLNVSRNSLSGDVFYPLQHDFDNEIACTRRISSSCGKDLVGLLDLDSTNTFTGDGLIQRPYYSFVNPCWGSSVTSDSGLELLNISDSTLVVAHDFSWNNFTGPLPLFSPLVTVVSSYWLLLNNNNFTASLSAEFVSSFCSSLLHNFYLNLNANRIYGELGSNFVNCSSLVHFEAAQNLIGGYIPLQVEGLKMLKYLDLSRNILIGSLPASLTELKVLKHIILSENNLTGQIPDQLGQLISLVVLNLSHNHLIGSIPTTLGEASGLEILLLDHNNLSGDIPSSLAALSDLTQLDLSFNNLSGNMPHFQHAFNCDGFRGNNFLQSCPNQYNEGSLAPVGFSYPIQMHRSHNPSKSKPYLLAIYITVSILLSIVAVLIGSFLGKRKRKLTRLTTLRKKVVVAFANAPVGLNYDNVIKATGNFSIENLIGTGGFGSTYKAEIVPGFLVAVKRLSIGRFQGIQQFDAEIRTLGRIRHKNLVTLIGYYVGEAEMFLIYNYLPGGNLETFIHQKFGMNKDWRVIHKIAVDIARALTYLHYSCVPRIVHRDIKPSNILLDEQQNAYLSDFGLARLLEVFETHATTDVAGTFGYVAPEYATTCRVSDKADVYSFGVVLLELLSGKKSLDPSFSEFGNGFNIVTWAGLLVSEGRCCELFSPELLESSSLDNLLGMLTLASSCTMESLSVRPSMKQVLENLKQLK